MNEITMIHGKLQESSLKVPLLQEPQSNKLNVANSLDFGCRELG